MKNPAPVIRAAEPANIMRIATVAAPVSGEGVEMLRAAIHSFMSKNR
jgi:hypothetical protein